MQLAGPVGASIGSSFQGTVSYCVDEFGPSDGVEDVDGGQLPGVIILLCLLLHGVTIHFPAVASDFHESVVQGRWIQALLSDHVRIR